MFLQLAVLAAFAAISIYFVVNMTYCYATAQGSVWERLLAAGKGSATKLWAKIVSAASALLGAVSAGAVVLDQPEIATAVQQYAKPEWVAGIMLVIMLITTLARNRTLRR